MADDIMRDILQRYIDDGLAKNLKEAKKLYDKKIQESMNKESTRVKIEEKKASGGMIKKYSYGGRVAKSSAEKS